MPLVTSKKIKHLSRYFGILGFLCLLGYGYTPFSRLFLITIGPVFYITYWFRHYAGFLSSLIPNEPLFNNLLLLFWTLIYFGLAGFQLKNILNERGKIRYLVLAAFFGFLFYIHYAAFQELDLYLAQEEVSSDIGTTRNLPLRDNKSEERVDGGGQEHSLRTDTADQSGF